MVRKREQEESSSRSFRVYSLTENIPRYPDSTCFLVLAQVHQWLQWLQSPRMLRVLQAVQVLQVLPSPLPAQAFPKLQSLQSLRVLLAYPELPSPLLEVVLLIDYSQST
jgi:hypothetical protein